LLGLLNEDLIQLLLKYQLNHDLFLGEFAIEKENVRVDRNGKLALTPHPQSFGKKIENRYIKTDFSESQIEMITPVFDSIEKTYNFLSTLHDIVALELRDEYLWPSSNPPVLPSENEIPIADMNNPIENVYRLSLAEKYGRPKQLFSGIHYNFSFKERFLKEWYEVSGKRQSFKDFKNSLYLKMVRNTLKYRWLLIYLTGASPVFDQSFLGECSGQGKEIAPESYLIQDMISLRNSEYGYRNKNSYFVSFHSIEEYIKDIKGLIETDELLSVKEYYSSVRLKPANEEHYFEGLRENGIAYIELRMVDLNPLEPIGISQETMHFIHLFLIYMLLKEDEQYGRNEHQLAAYYSDTVNRTGVLEAIFTADELNRSTDNKALQLLNDMEEMVRLLNPASAEYLEVLKKNKEKINKKERLFAKSKGLFTRKLPTWISI
jgi:glutamate--cysteine ligase